LGNARNIAFWVVLFLLVLALFNLFSGGQTTMASNARSLFGLRVGRGVRHRRAGHHRRRGGALPRRDGRDYVTVLPPDAEVTNLLIERQRPRHRALAAAVGLHRLHPVAAARSSC
jgi:cell division protease FtsH